ncbi:MAG: type VI secretion system ATPase TssH, partial [bacterium]|nr:type VI secretion system ATPase TssH [bacterium]
MDRLTHKSQEAVQAAQTRALRFGHQEVDGEHLLLCLLEQADGILPSLLGKLSVQAAAMVQALEAELNRKPRVSGSGYEQGKFYVTPRWQKLMANAEEEADHLK